MNPGAIFTIQPIFIIKCTIKYIKQMHACPSFLFKVPELIKKKKNMCRMHALLQIIDLNREIISAKGQIF